MPTETNVVGNLYKGDGKFSRVNLDRLAAKVSDFSNVDDMIAAAKEGTVKTSSDFGNTVVNFGSYSFNGVTRELSWVPVYLSKSGDDAILTLWLANTAAENGTFSNQEISSFSDGSYSRTYNKTYNSAVVYSNTYDSSYIRNYVLNGSEDYAKVWNEGAALTPPALDTMSKFTQLVSGELSDYIVEPCNVNWQMSENKMKNDPACNAVGNYPNAWTNDKLWLPSMYEVFDSALPANGIPSSWTEDGGLWKTGNNSNRQKRSNAMHTWLRSGYPSTDYYFVYDLVSNGNTGGGCVNNAYAVRPALHLNLTSAKQDATIDAPKDITGLSYDGNSKWITDLGTAKPAWLDLDIYNNTAYMSVKSISYEDTAGNAAKPVSTSNISLVNAGKYTVTMTAASGIKWTGDTTTGGDKTFKITVDRIKPTVTAAFKETLPTNLYVSYNDGKLPELKNSATNATAGTIGWQEGQSPSATNTTYYWEFTPTDTVNYLKITGKSDDTKITVPYKTQTVSKLEITLNKVQDEDGKDTETDVTIYDAFVLTDAKEGEFSLKDYITVKAVYQDGITKETLGSSGYKLSIVGGATKLSEGKVKIRATQASGTKTGELEINVIKSAVEEIEASYDDDGTHLVYSDELSIDDIKGNLTVTAKWNYSDSDFLSVDVKNVEVTGTIEAGEEVEFTAKYGEKTCTFKVAIDKGEYSISSSLFADKTITHTGTAFTLDRWIDEDKLPDGVSVTYSCTTDLIAIGEHTVKATFTTTDANYNAPAEMTAKLTISDKPTYKMDGVTFDNDEVKYDGKTHKLEIVGELPEGVTVKYYVDDEEFTGATIVGDYEIVAKFTGSDTYAPIPDKKATLKITKADVDMSGVKFENSKVAYDGKEHTLTISGTLPDGVTVEYEVKNQSGKSFTEIGTYEFTATFTVSDTKNYNAIADKTATLTISDASILGITAKAANDKFTTVNTLDDLKKVLTVTVNTTGGDSVTEDYELSCDGLRDGGKFKYGFQKITVKYTDGDGNEYSAFVEIRVEKEKVALPTFKGGLKYTGVAFKPTANDFNGYDETLMTFVVDKTVPGLSVGSYKAVFALNDPESYEWATATTLKKAVFAVVYDEMVLNANEAAVDWNISKAVLTATKTDGALPVFASESFIGAFADVVTLKYYKDEACTEEVAAADLAHETQYFVKAELLDTENFELDSSAAQYTVKSFTYTTPAKELTTWDKIVRFLKANWLWLVIAVVALILFIVVIALIARAAKKKRERAELAEQRRLEKEEREREERKLEREERMARLSQQQAMPQMMMPQMMPQMPQPQYMPQQMPQQVQSAPAGGGASSSELAELKAEISALRVAQESMRAEQTAKELAEIKALHTAEQQIAQAKTDLRVDNLSSRLGSERTISGGLTAATLVEMVTAAMEKVLDSREKGAAQTAPATPESATPAATQVPPDAVMTTVTTTKIDTTKKPAQPAQTTQAAAPVRTVVRNVVAPMPVDDGRVFDVGGFYKPADPTTDLNFDDEEKK